MTDIATLGIKVDSSGVAEGVTKLDGLVAASQKAEEAQAGLAEQSKAASSAIAAQGQAAAQATSGLNAMSAQTVAIKESNEQAEKRIRDMVRASLEQTKAALSTASAVREAAQATQSIGSAPQKGASLASSLADSQRELASLDEALAHQSQSLEDVGEKRAWLSDIYKRGLISLDDNEAHLKTLDRQEAQVKGNIDAHAKSVQALIAAYDPASAALKKIAADEIKLSAALKDGSINQEQYNRAVSGLNVNKAKWQAEALAVGELDKGLKGISLTSGYALRQYHYMIDGLARGNFGQVAREAGGLATQTGLLAAAFNPVTIAVTAAAVIVGAFVYAAVQAERENSKLTNALIFTGNAAGVTAGQLRGMAVAVQGIGVSHREAISALASIAGSGQVAGKNLQYFVEVAEKLNQTVGVPVEETLKQFEELGRSPTEATKKLQQQYGYLTSGVLDQIRALEQQGNIQAAAEVAQKAFADAQSQRTTTATAQLGLYQRGWIGLKKAIADVEDHVVDALNVPALLIEGKTARQKTAEIESISAAEAAAAAQHTKDVNAENLADERLIKTLNARFEATKQIAQAQLQSDAGGVQRALAAQVSDFQAANAMLDALRQTDLIRANIYYDKKRELIQSETAARVKALQDENTLIHRESELTKDAAKSAIGRAVGPENEGERIKIEADAQAKVIANNQKIADNQQKIAGLRTTEAIQLTGIAASQQELTRSVQLYNASIDEQRHLLGLDVEQRDVEAQALAHERELRSKGIELTKEESAALRASLKDLQDFNTLISAQDRLLAASVGQQRAYTTQLAAIKALLEKKGSRFTKGDAAEATVSTIGADVLRGTQVAADANAEIYKRMYSQIEEARQADLISSRDASLAKINIWQLEHQEQIDKLKGAFGDIATLTSSGNRKAFEIGKAAALTQATLDAETGIMNAFATSPWYVGLALGIGAAARLYGQVERIKNIQFQGYMTGGYTGDKATDSIAGIVHGKEYVLNAAATARVGVAKLDSINSGGSTSLTTGNAANSPHYWKPPPLNIVVQNYGSSKIDVQQLSPTDVRIIARDEAQKTVGEQTPRLIASEISNPNSKVSKSLSKNTQAQRKR